MSQSYRDYPWLETPGNPSCDVYILGGTKHARLPKTGPLNPECLLGNVLFSRAPFASENGIRCFASRIWARETSIFVPRPRHITYPGITAWLGI